MRKSIISLLFVLFSVTISAFAVGGDEIPKEDVQLMGKIYRFPTGLEGCPYLSIDWQQTSVYLENGKVATDIKGRFDILNNDLIFYNESLKRVFVAEKDFVNSFVLYPGTPDSLFFFKYQGEDVGYRLKNNDFVHALYRGKINFFVKHLADVVRANNVGAKDEIFPKNFYFVQIGDNTYSFKPRYKYVYQIFPKKRKEIRKLISENKIRKATENNLKVLFSLIEKNESIMGAASRSK